jgi:hypothetical protein
MQGKFTHTCSRCGAQETPSIPAEEDYLELCHEHMALQAEYRRVLGLLRVLRAYATIKREPVRVADEEYHF